MKIDRRRITGPVRCSRIIAIICNNSKAKKISITCRFATVTTIEGNALRKSVFPKRARSTGHLMGNRHRVTVRPVIQQRTIRLSLSLLPLLYQTIIFVDVVNPFKRGTLQVPRCISTRSLRTARLPREPYRFSLISHLFLLPSNVSAAIAAYLVRDLIFGSYRFLTSGTRRIVDTLPFHLVFARISRDERDQPLRINCAKTHLISRIITPYIRLVIL